MEKEIHILYKETMAQSIICDSFSVVGILLCLFVSEKTGSIFFTTLSLLALAIFLIPFGGNKKKFRSKEALNKWLNGDDCIDS